MSCLAGHESEKSTIITTGMHRSGTSFTAALLQSAGVDLGQRLLGCHESNPRGHFENRDFVEFHRKVLQSQGINEAGYTLQEKIDVEEHYVEEAQQIISENSISQLWGWKDPRTSLFLDFWADLLPNSLFLMIYRSPWEVVDSLYRRGTDSLILSHPELAVKVWIRYNKKLLDFYDNFPERCYLTNIHQVAEDPQGFIEKANAKFKTNLSFAKSEIYDQSLLHKEVSKLPGAALVSHYFPEALDIYRELELRANRIDEDTDVSWFKELNTSRYRIKTFQNWLAIRNLEKERKSIQVELEQTQTQLEQAQAQQQQTQTQLEQTQTEQSRNVEKLIHWIEQLDSLILSMVNSNRWKFGSFFYFIYRKVLFKPLDPPPQEHLDNITTQFEAWNQKTGTLNNLKSTSLDSQKKLSFKQSDNFFVKFASPFLRLPNNIHFYEQFNLKLKQSNNLAKLIKRLSCEQEMQLIPEKEKRQLVNELLTLPQTTLISIIMPTWNRAKTVKNAIYSIQAQTYKNWELHVVDDGSEDESEEIIRKLAKSDNRIKYHKIEHQGVSTARNVGLSQAKGDAIAYLDSDNTWDRNYLLFMLNAITSSGHSCAYSAINIIGSKNYTRKISFNLNKLLKDNYIDINVFVHKRQLYDEMGGLDPYLKRWVDWDLILRYATCYPPATVPLALCNYYENGSERITAKESEAYKFKVLNKHLLDWELLSKEAEQRTCNHVTIIIPVYNKAELTEACIESIFTQTKGIEFDIVVVDNASRDSTKKVIYKLKEKYRNLKYVQNHNNYGFALGCNLGVAASRGEFITFLNNDTRVLPNWLVPLIDPMKEDFTVGIVGPKLLFPDDTLQSGGMVFNNHSKLPYPLYQGRSEEDPVINKQRFFQAVTGACFAMRAKDFIDLKGFDPIYMNGCEDLDFCFRLRKDLNKQIFYNPASAIYHLEGKTEGRSKAIMYNREKFVDSWRHAIVPDDKHYYAQDGFAVREYVKKGTEPHGETAAYFPTLEKKSGLLSVNFLGDVDNSQLNGNGRLNGVHSKSSTALHIKRPQKTLDIGFCSIWHQRGICFQTKQLAEALEGSNFKTHIFARWESQKFCNASSIYHPRVFNAGDDPSSDEMLQWIKSNNIDLVIFMEVHPKDWKRVNALKRAGIKVMAYENLDILRCEYLEQYKKFDYFLSNSFYSCAVLKEKFPNIPILTIPWGIEPNNVFLNKASQRDDHIEFVHIAGWGGLNNRKNTDLIIKAFHEASLPNVTLRLYTQAPIEKYGEECLTIAKDNNKLKLQEGIVENIYSAYQDADMLLFPSKREGLGLPIVEALASGLPVLTSDGYMMKQWLIPEEHGVLCSATPLQGRMFLPEMQVDTNDLIMQLRRLSEHPEQIAEMKQKVLRDRAIWLWTWQKEILREQIRLIAENSGYCPPEDLSYLPEEIKKFERKRLEQPNQTVS